MTPDQGADDAPLTLADLMPAPTRRSRRPWKAVGIVAVAVVVLAGLGALVWVLRPVPASARTIGPSKAAAVRECRSAVESEAQRRTTAANSGEGAVATVGGVDMADPVWSTPAWKVDATIRFNLVSIFGQTPATVYVRCTASMSGGKVSTSISSR